MGIINLVIYRFTEKQSLKSLLESGYSCKLFIISKIEAKMFDGFRMRCRINKYNFHPL